MIRLEHRRGGSDSSLLGLSAGVRDRGSISRSAGTSHDLFPSKRISAKGQRHEQEQCEHGREDNELDGEAPA